jgi:sulfur-carrier protein adenylyltransferase/sulfurtransferase
MNGKSGAFDAYTAFQSNLGVVSGYEQLILRSKKIAIPGLGGVGSTYCNSLVRMGFENFVISDMDVFEVNNFNRQAGARINTVGREKIEVCAEDMISINPCAKVKMFPEGINAANVDQFIDGVDIVADSLDFFAFDARILLYRKAREYNIPVVTAAPLSLSAGLLVFHPHSMSFDEYFDIKDSDDDRMRFIKFGLGVAPRLLHFSHTNFKNSHSGAPSSIVGMNLCAALMTTEILKILLERGPSRAAPHYLQFDSYLQRLVRGNSGKGNRSLVNRLKIYFADKFIHPKDPLSKAFGNPKDAAESLICAASLAPSGDNLQPIRYRVGKTTLTFTVDKTVDQSQFNRGCYMSRIAMGASIENVESVLQENAGGPSEIRIGEDGLSATATHDLVAGADPMKIPDWVFRRQSNRSKFRNEELHSSVLEELRGIDFRDLQNIQCHWITEKDQLEPCRQLVKEATKKAMEDERNWRFLLSTIRTDNSARTGLTPNSIGIPPFASKVMHFLARLPFAIQKKLLVNQVVKDECKRASQGSGFFCVTVEQGAKNPDIFPEVGRAAQRAWLILTKLQIAAQPMNSVTGLMYSNPKIYDDFRIKHNERFTDLFSDRDVAWTMRFGIADFERNGTLRKPLEELVSSPSIP